MQFASLYPIDKLARVRRSFQHGETRGNWTGIVAVHVRGTWRLSTGSAAGCTHCLMRFFGDRIFWESEISHWKTAICSLHCTIENTNSLHSYQLHSLQGQHKLAWYNFSAAVILTLIPRPWNLTTSLWPTYSEDNDVHLPPNQKWSCYVTIC